MDITSIFKDCVSHNQKSQQDVDSILSESGKQDNKKPVSHVKSSVFPGKKSEHFSKAKEISSNITKLRDFLKDCRTAYVNIGASKQASANSSVFYSAAGLSSGSCDIPLMSDKERDQIDNDVQLIVKNCQKTLHDFQIYTETNDSIQSQPQLHTHLENVVNSLANYLKQVTEIYSEMRAIRVKRTVDYQAMSRLATHPTSNRGLKNKTRRTSLDRNDGFSSPKRNMPDWDKQAQSPSSSSGMTETDGLSTMSGSNITETDTPVPTYFQDDDDAMSPEELQMLEQENAALLNELNNLSQEVEQIESSVVEIAQLQTIFTEKVLQQEKDVDRIGNLIVHATENIRGGNEQVRQAIQKSADFRAWVLFFIMVMSFSILFLDWYND